MKQTQLFMHQFLTEGQVLLHRLLTTILVFGHTILAEEIGTENKSVGWERQRTENWIHYLNR